VTLRAGETERVGQLLLERIPEFGSLVILERQDSVVVALELLVLLVGGRNRTPGRIAIAVVSPSVTTAGSSSISTTFATALEKLSVNQKDCKKGRATGSSYAKVLASHLMRYV
jgi:hypothetical protein